MLGLFLLPQNSTSLTDTQMAVLTYYPSYLATQATLLSKWKETPMELLDVGVEQ